MKLDTKLESLLFAQNRMEQERVYRKHTIEQSLIGTQTIMVPVRKVKNQISTVFYLKTSLV